MWSRSVVARLMLPVALMLVLVILLGTVSLASRARLHAAYDALQENQHLRAGLVETRSLSRSLQRDALNLILEDDRAELRVLHEKFRSRSSDMRAQLVDLRGDPTFVRDRGVLAYFATQRAVQSGLADVADTATRGQRDDAWALFRH